MLRTDAPPEAPKRKLFPVWIHVPDRWTDFSDEIKLGNVIQYLDKPDTSVIHTVDRDKLSGASKKVTVDDFKHNDEREGSYKVGFWMHLLESIQAGLT